MVAIVGLAVLIPAFMLVFPNMAHYFSGSVDPTSRESVNVFARYDLTVSLLSFFRHNPILGNGPGLIQDAAQRGVYGFSGLVGVENQYALILADGGLVAGVTYLLFAGGAVAIALRLYHSADRELTSIGLMLLTLFAYYSVVAASVDALLSVAMAVMMCLMGAATALCDTRGTDTSGSTGGEPGYALSCGSEHQPM